MQLRGGHAVEVLDELGADRAETPQVEVGVEGLKGIVGPGDDGDAGLQGIGPLGPLELQADPALLVLGPYGQHVRVEMGHAAPQRGEGVREADGLSRRGLRQMDETSGPRRGDELDGGGDLDVGQAPHLALEAHAALEIAAVAGEADADVIHGARSLTRASVLARCQRDG